MVRLIRMTKNFVFTSAGDNTKFTEWWCADSKNYDIYLIYYGNNDDNYSKYAKFVQHIERRQGSKFQNFYYFYKTYPEIIAKYERFFILDDDIEISSNDINRMFEISEKHNLLICAPSFTKDSKISHQITVNKPGVSLEFTNFIEVNAPLYNKEALGRFIARYDPILIGWGVDYLSIWANSVHRKKSYAIIHEISCKNPKDTAKGGKRELTNVSNANLRIKIWRDFASNLKCPFEYKHCVHEQILLPVVDKTLLDCKVSP